MLSLNDRLTEIFINHKLITKSQLDQALRVQAHRGGNLSDIIVELKLVKQPQLSNTLSKDLRLPLFDLKHFEIDQKVVKTISAETARRYQAIPLSKTDDSVTLAMADPLNVLAIQKLPALRGLKISPIICSAQDISQAVELYYPSIDSVDIDDLVKELASPIEIVKQEKEAFLSDQELQRLSNEAPAIKATNLVLEEAIMIFLEHNPRTYLRLSSETCLIYPLTLSISSLPLLTYLEAIENLIQKIISYYPLYLEYTL